jgi:hypothetical protein
MSTITDRIARQKREEHSYKKMLSFGWTPEQASGIVGNLKYESNLETTREGDVGYKGGSSFGIAQFRGNRLQKLKEMYGKDWTDLDNQLDFVNWELNNTHKKAGDRLRQVKGVYNTGRVMSDDYEIPAKKWNSNDDRQRAVFDLHQKYSGVALTDEDRANFNKKKENTSSFTNFEMEENRGNLATVPDVEEKPEVAEAIKTLDSKQNEENFLKAMFSKQNEDFTVAEPKKVVAQQIAPTNIMETYAKIDNFVEAQQGGAIEEDKKWLQNWYGNRVIPNKDINDIYQKSKSEYEDLSHAIPNPIYRGFIPAGEGITDLTSQAVHTKNNEIMMVSPENETTYTHEADHFIYTNANAQDMNDVHDNVVKYNLAPQENIRNPNIRNNYQYYSRPTEIHSRVQEFRKKAGFKPNQELKKEDIDRFKKTYKGGTEGINDLFDMTDTEHLLEVMNNMVDNNERKPNNLVQQGGTVSRDLDKFLKTRFKKELENQKQDKANQFNSNYVPTSDKYKKQLQERIKNTSQLKQDTSTEKDRESNKERHDQKEWDSKRWGIYENIATTAELGNFIPHPVAQVVGKVGSIASATLATRKAKLAYDNEDYENIGLNLGMVGLGGVSNKFVRLGTAGVDYFTDFNTEQEQNQQGGIISDNQGQWAYPGDVTKIEGGNITMKGVNYPVLGVSDKGEQQMMYPNKNYQFQGAESVTEYPQLTEKEKNFLKAVQKYKNRK